jgi:Ca2+-binding EF-hand superfamily protein
VNELQSWIRNVSKLYMMKNVESRWKTYDPNNTGSISIDSLLAVNYGSLQFCKLHVI